jgi:hypothetical protein
LYLIRCSVAAHRLPVTASDILGGAALRRCVARSVMVVMVVVVVVLEV